MVYSSGIISISSSSGLSMRGGRPFEKVSSENGNGPVIDCSARSGNIRIKEADFLEWSSGGDGAAAYIVQSGEGRVANREEGTATTFGGRKAGYDKYGGGIYPSVEDKNKVSLRIELDLI